MIDSNWFLFSLEVFKECPMYFNKTTIQYVENIQKRPLKYSIPVCYYKMLTGCPIQRKGQFISIKMSVELSSDIYCSVYIGHHSHKCTYCVIAGSSDFLISKVCYDQ